MQKQNSIASKIIIILFLITLILPVSIQILDLEKNVINNENRKHAKLPKFKLSSPLHSIAEFKSYYLSNYGSKTTLTNNYIKFKSEILNENPIPNQVIEGKDGWLFAGNNYNNVLNNSFGNDDFTEKELNQTISFFDELKSFLDSKNISFYLVVPPDKNRLYQEFLPYTLRQQPTKLETLEKALKNETNIELINLYKPLLNSKSQHEHYLYLKTDTHWNYYGAHIGYSTIINEINNQHKVNKIPLDDFMVTEIKTNPMDLSKMINLKNKETTYKIEHKSNNDLNFVNSTIGNIHIKNKDKPLKTMLYKDSFTNAMMPFFNRTFSEIVYNRNYSLDKNKIENFKPDILIFEIIERNIDYFAKIKPFKN